MNWHSHLIYVQGAFLGALLGSFFVHCFDTVATRKFAFPSSRRGKGFVRALLVSYFPVVIGMVPARAICFGVYSICIEFLLMHDVSNYFISKIIAGHMGGLCLSILSLPAEFVKTCEQTGNKVDSIKFNLLKRTFVPLYVRITPTFIMMLAGTEIIRSYLPIHGIILSTVTASYLASLMSQIIGTPSENIRISRILKSDSSISKLLVSSEYGFRDLYTGFLYRSFALGTQASFTLSSANLFKFL